MHIQHPQFPVSDFRLEPKQRSRWRTREHLPVFVVDAVMAGADEFFFLGFIGNRTFFVPAYQAENNPFASRLGHENIISVKTYDVKGLLFELFYFTEPHLFFVEQPATRHTCCGCR